jgi:hypothetical protein
MSVTNNFGNVCQVRGFQPLATMTPAAIPQSEWTPISTSSVLALFQGSLVKVVAGQVLSAVAGDSGKIAGAIRQIRDSSGNQVQNVAATPASGYECIYTTDPNQVFVGHMSSAAYADTDIGSYYNLSSTEPATVGTDRWTAPGYGYSGRTLDGATEAASGKQMIVIGRPRYERNDAGVSGTMVFCQINPSNFSRGDAS